MAITAFVLCPSVYKNDKFPESLHFFSQFYYITDSAQMETAIMYPAAASHFMDLKSAGKEPVSERMQLLSCFFLLYML